MYDGIDMTHQTAMNPAMDWAFVDRLRNYWKGKLIIKGIDTREDASLCVEHGVDAILVSNHGGRATETSAVHHRGAARSGRRSRRIAFPCSSTAAFVTAPTFSRRSRWARRAWGSGGRIFRAWERSARPAWIACWRFCKAS